MPSLKYFLSLGEDVLLPIGGSKKKGIQQEVYYERGVL
jgi:hypothetical protein